MSKARPVAAPLGSLPADVLADLIALRDFETGRDRALRALFGVRLARSELRDELIRAVMIEFGLGRLRPMSYYQKAFTYLGGPSSVRGELHMMIDLGIMLAQPAEHDRRVVHVVPSVKLVSWYATQMPGLVAEAVRVLGPRLQPFKALQ